MTKKALTFPILISMVIGNMVGTGIYILPATLAEYGSISLLAWFITSIGAIFVALTFVNLNQRFPKTGGPYLYCKEAFGRLAGFIVAYTYWASNIVCTAGVIIASIGYLGFISPALNANSAHYQPLTVLLLEIATVWLLTLINLIGLHTAGIIQLCLTILKIIPLLLISFIGLGSIHWENLTSMTHLGSQSLFATLSSACALTFWAFIGLEAATIPSENTTGTKTIAKATVFGTISASLIYILSTFVLMGMLPAAVLKGSQFPFADASSMLLGENVAIVIALCALIAGLGTANVCILILGQLVFAAARDNLLPKCFAKLSKNEIPVSGHILSSILVTLLLMMTVEPTLLKQFNKIALLGGLLTLSTYFMTTLSELKFIIQNRKWQPLFLSKSIIITLLAATYSFWMISSLDKSIITMGFLLVIISIPLYFFTTRKEILTSFD